MKDSQSSKKQENQGLNLVFNIVVPAILMMKGASWFGLSSAWALGIALAFPISYGLYDFITRREWNVLSIVGFVSVLLTGVIGLLKLPKEWIAAKEAAIPLAIGIAVLITLKTRISLVRVLLYNDRILSTGKIDEAIAEQGNQNHFDKLLKRATVMLACSFFLSAALNYGLAKVFIQSETGTQAFTEELGKMTAWSYPVIALPCTGIMMLILWRLIRGIQILSGLKKEEIFASLES